MCSNAHCKQTNKQTKKRTNYLSDDLSMRKHVNHKTNIQTKLCDAEEEKEALANKNVHGDASQNAFIISIRNTHGFVYMIYNWNFYK